VNILSTISPPFGGWRFLPIFFSILGEACLTPSSEMMRSKEVVELIFTKDVTAKICYDLNCLHLSLTP
jgi:hypothetical protein